MRVKIVIQKQVKQGKHHMCGVCRPIRDRKAASAAKESGKKAEMEPELSPSPEQTDDRYYEDLINGRIPARTGFNSAIQAHTKKDAGLVLAMIGLDHPAAKSVYKYLVLQKYEKYGSRVGYLLMRHVKAFRSELPHS